MRRVKVAWSWALGLQLVLTVTALADLVDGNAGSNRRYVVHSPDDVAIQNRPRQNELLTDDVFVADTFLPAQGKQKKRGEDVPGRQDGRTEDFFGNGRDGGRQDQVKDTHAGGKHRGNNLNGDRNQNAELINAILNGDRGDNQLIEDFLNGNGDDQFNQLLNDLLGTGQGQGRGRGNGRNGQSDREILQIIESILFGNTGQLTASTSAAGRTTQTRAAQSQSTTQESAETDSFVLFRPGDPFTPSATTSAAESSAASASTTALGTTSKGSRSLTSTTGAETVSSAVSSGVSSTSTTTAALTTSILLSTGGTGGANTTSVLFSNTTLTASIGTPSAGITVIAGGGNGTGVETLITSTTTVTRTLTTTAASIAASASTAASQAEASQGQGITIIAGPGSSSPALSPPSSTSATEAAGLPPAGAILFPAPSSSSSPNTATLPISSPIVTVIPLPPVAVPTQAAALNCNCACLCPDMFPSVVPPAPSFQLSLDTMSPPPAPTPSTLQTVTTAVDSGAAGSVNEVSSTVTIALDTALLPPPDPGAQVTPAPQVGENGGGGLTQLPLDLARITFESVVTVHLGGRGVSSAGG